MKNHDTFYFQAYLKYLFSASPMNVEFPSALSFDWFSTFIIFHEANSLH